MQISNKGLALVEASEGLRLTAYRDVAGILTIGYGHTGNDVLPGMIISADKAKSLLVADLQTAEKIVTARVAVPLTQGQFDALVDFAFNVGQMHFSRSRLLIKLNAKDYVGAAGEFEKWVFAAGVYNAGLAKRRQAEKELFLS